MYTQFRDIGTNPQTFLQIVSENQKNQNYYDSSLASITENTET